jgi:hypothetical protein
MHIPRVAPEKRPSAISAGSIEPAGGCVEEEIEDPAAGVLPQVAETVEPADRTPLHYDDDNRPRRANAVRIRLYRLDKLIAVLAFTSNSTTTTMRLIGSLRAQTAASSTLGRGWGGASVCGSGAIFSIIGSYFSLITT